MNKNALFRTAKDVAFIGIMVAVLIAGQLVLSMIAGVEIVTVLFLSYCVAFGVRRGMIVGTVFSLMRCLLFGFIPNVVVVYLIYYNLFAVIFGFAGKWTAHMPLLAKIAVLCVMATAVTACFTLLDDLVSPLILGLSARGARVYFYASLPVMIGQMVCAAVTVALLWYPLSKVFMLVQHKSPPPQNNENEQNFTYDPPEKGD